MFCFDLFCVGCLFVSFGLVFALCFMVVVVDVVVSLFNLFCLFCFVFCFCFFVGVCSVLFVYFVLFSCFCFVLFFHPD